MDVPVGSVRDRQFRPFETKERDRVDCCFPLENDEPLRCTCVIDDANLEIVADDGVTYPMALPFSVSKMHASQMGLIFERNPVASEKMALPLLFGLIHPLKDISPVVLNQSRLSHRVGFLTADSRFQFVGICADWNLAVIYSKADGSHSVWQIRMATEEDMRALNLNIPSTSLADPTWSVDSPSAFSGSKNISVLSRSLMSPIGPLGTSSSNNRLSQQQQSISSPNVTKLKNQSLSSDSISRGLSPLRTSRLAIGPASPLMRSFCSPGTTPSAAVPIQSSPKNLARRISSAAIGSPFGRLCTTPIMQDFLDIGFDNSNEAIKPDLCFDLLWNDQNNQCLFKARKVFVTRDFTQQTFLACLIEQQQQLRLTKFERASDSERFIFGSTHILSAKDAEPIAGKDLLVIVDVYNTLNLYSGTAKIDGLVSMPVISDLCWEIITNAAPGISTAVDTAAATTAVDPSSGHGRKSTSIFQSSFRRSGSSFSSYSERFSAGASSSHLNASGLTSKRFSLGSRILSPVMNERHESSVASIATSTSTAGCSHRTSYECQSIRTLRSIPSVTSVQDAADKVHDFAVVSHDACRFRVSLPSIGSSTSVKHALNALKALLPRDICMQLLVKWYALRNSLRSHAPGLLTDAVELEMFKNCLLSLVGYDVDEANSSLQESSKVIKKLKLEVDESGADEDWVWMEHLHSAETDATNGSLKPAAVSGLVPSLLFPYMPTLLYALHLTMEELKLNELAAAFVQQLIDVLFRLATDLRQVAYQDEYWRCYPDICARLHPLSLIDEADARNIIYPNFFLESPPSIFHFLQTLLRWPPTCTPIRPFPYIRNPDCPSRIRQCVLLYVCATRESFAEQDYLLPVNCTTTRLINNDEFANYASAESSRELRLLDAMSKLGITQNDLHTMPASLSLPLWECISLCRKDPPTNCSTECYRLLGREDLLCTDTTVSQRNAVCDHEFEEEAGIPMVNREALRLLYSDRRIYEAYHLLQSSKPVKISIPQRPGISDHDFIEDQERHLYTISIRTMALPVGRGMFMLRTYKPVIAETFPIPKLCLSGRVPPRNTTVELSRIDVPANMNTWPLFHNGVAAGLSASTSASGIIDSSWIVYNKPKSSSSLASEAQNEHAGFLLALGFNGHLSKLSMMNVHEYLCKGNELTRVAVLLGLAAARRGTMDTAATKMLSIHVEALLPPTSTELDVPPVVQVAAVLGIGLLYQGSGQHHMAKVLLGEIARPPGPEMEHYIDRESYALAAGLAFGLVMLGKGNEMVSLVSSAESVSMADQLCNYMIGGYKKPLTTVQREKYKTPSYQIREGDYVNADVTSPGATLALGMLFFDTNNEAVAKWVSAPDTQHLLETVRPDFLLLRTLAKGLIMWSHIEATKQWVEAHLPPVVARHAFKRGEHENNVNNQIDYETMSQAYCNIVAGACMAMALKYAGSADPDAYELVMDYAKMFLQLPNKPKLADQAGRSTIESCINVVVLSLSLIMAGTGDVEVMKICRYLRSRTSQTNVVLYGSFMATHMALGFLFLGACRYTLSTAPEAIAALVCALFPKFPIHSNDNRYHLQAFRHLYALAVEPRLIIPRDIATSQVVYVNLLLKYRRAESEAEARVVKLRAPCLIPELKGLEEVSIDDERYWKISFRRQENWQRLRDLLNSSGGVINVKQKVGCLPYHVDPNGFQSIHSQYVMKDAVKGWNVKPQTLMGFSNDAIALNFSKFVLVRRARLGRERTLQQHFCTLLMYCSTQETMECLPALMQLNDGLRWPQQQLPSTYDSRLVWSTKLAVVLAPYCRILEDQFQERLKAFLAARVTGCNINEIVRYLTGELPMTSLSVASAETMVVCDMPRCHSLAGKEIEVVAGEESYLKLVDHLWPLGMPLDAFIMLFDAIS